METKEVNKGVVNVYVGGKIFATITTELKEHLMREEDMSELISQLAVTFQKLLDLKEK